MKITGYALGMIFCSSTCAVKYSLLLHQELNEHRMSVSARLPRTVRPESQNTLQEPIIFDVRSHQYPRMRSSIEESFGSAYVYTTNMSFGTPPQTFRAIIDIAWSETFVPSTTCAGRECQIFRKHYNPSSSSTYVVDGTNVTIRYPPVDAEGHISTDTLTLGDTLRVPAVNFVELDFYQPGYNVGREDLPLFDSVLGLAIDQEWPPVQPKPQVPGLFRQMVNRGVLDRNLFSILWPRSPSLAGDITFGGFNSDVSNTLVSHPLFPHDTTHWQIRLQSLRAQTPGGSKRIDLLQASSGEPQLLWTALFMSTTPYISLPESMFVPIWHEIPWEKSKCPYPDLLVVDCSRIHELPHFTFNFQGQEITLTGEDYTERVTAVDDECNDIGRDECIPRIGQLPGFMDWVTPDMVVLGMSFLRKVYSVFDWDEKTISFGKLPDKAL